MIVTVTSDSKSEHTSGYLESVIPTTAAAAGSVDFYTLDRRLDKTTQYT